MDTFAADLHKALLTRNLTEIVDVIFVSDHGMTDTSHPEPVLLDEILGEQGYADIEHEDGIQTPVFLLLNSLIDLLIYRVAECRASFQKDVQQNRISPQTIGSFYGYRRISV